MKTFSRILGLKKGFSPSPYRIFNEWYNTKLLFARRKIEYASVSKESATENLFICWTDINAPKEEICKEYL